VVPKGVARSSGVEGQSWAQAPPTQASPAGQALPASAPVQLPLAPQKSGLLPGSTQAPPQLMRPEPQERTQLPPVQSSPGPHTVPASAPLQPLAPQ